MGEVVLRAGLARDLEVLDAGDGCEGREGGEEVGLLRRTEAMAEPEQGGVADHLGHFLTG